MKKQNFQQSLLAVGVIAALGLSGTAIAAETAAVAENFDVTNVATATYQVDGETQEEVASNPVTVTVSKVIQFELTDNNDKKVTPDGTVTFDHKLTNKGNTDDTYKVKVEDLTDDDFNYENTTVKYKTPDMDDYEEIPDEGITLKPGETADIQVKTKASDNDKDEVGKLKVTAESTLNPEESGKVTNTDTATTVTPIFAIKKTAEVTQIIAGSTAPFEYRIQIKNTGNMDANGVTIEDELPAGLVFADNKELSVQINGSDVNPLTDDSTDTKLVLKGINIAKDSAETLVVKFKVKPVNATDGTTYENIATVKHTPTGDGTEGGGKEIVDTSKHDDDVAGDPDDVNDTPAPTIQVLEPGVTFTPPKDITLPPTGANDTKDSVFKHTITNTGTTDQDNLTLTTDVTLDDNNISQTIYVDNGDGIFNPSEDTEYTGTTLPTIKPGKHLDIFVVNESDNANPGTAGVSALREEYTITVEGTGLATAPTVTDTVKIAALELKKEQAVDDCNKDLSKLTFSKAAVTNAEPGQCIYYQISAINHLPESNPTQQLKDITNLMISDTLDEVGTGLGKVTFNNDITNTGLTNAATYDSGTKTVSSSGNTLAAEKTAKVNFSVKINER